MTHHGTERGIYKTSAAYGALGRHAREFIVELRGQSYNRTTVFHIRRCLARLGVHIETSGIAVADLNAKAVLDFIHNISADARRRFSKAMARKFIASQEEVRKLVEAAGQLPSELGLRGYCYSTFFGLLAAAGLRVSEALGLDTRDVDFSSGIATVREGKLGKPRQLPLSPSTLHQIQDYIARRDRLLGYPTRPLFVSEAGTRPSLKGVNYNFSIASERAGLRQRSRYQTFGNGPRMHDLRHTFAVRVIIDWYRQGLDISQEILKLTTYLGHDDPAHTYWYMEAVPELLRLASDRAQENSTRERGQ